MLPPGLPGGWKKPVHGFGGGEVGSWPQAKPNAPNAKKLATTRIEQTDTFAMIPARLARVGSQASIPADAIVPTP
jgi:hypothetical protein